MEDQMTLLRLIQRVRTMTRDLTNSIFRESDITDFINEAIMRCRQVIPQLQSMPTVTGQQEKVTALPSQYHHLLAVYAVSRCFAQDERHYQATTFMNEFEVKLEELKSAVESGEVVIKDEHGEEIIPKLKTDYVNLRPYHITSPEYVLDDDEGVEGVNG